MENIAKRLNAYITATLSTPVTVIVKPSLISFTKPTRNPTKVIHRKSVKISRNWKSSSVLFLWKITMLSSTSAAASAVPMSAKLSLMVSNMVRT